MSSGPQLGLKRLKNVVTLGILGPLFKSLTHVQRNIHLTFLNLTAMSFSTRFSMRAKRAMSVEIKFSYLNASVASHSLKLNHPEPSLRFLNRAKRAMFVHIETGLCISLRAKRAMSTIVEVYI